MFDFRAFLNLAMLLTESDRARLLRQAILDIVIDTINQRDEDFVHAPFVEGNYHVAAEWRGRGRGAETEDLQRDFREPGYLKNISIFSMVHP